MIELICLILASLYIPVSLLFLKKEPKLQEFIILFIAIITISKCAVILYDTILENQNNELLIYLIVGVITLGWISYDKIYHIFKASNKVD